MLSGDFLAPGEALVLGGLRLCLRRFTVAGYQAGLPLPYQVQLPASMVNAVSRRQAEFLAGRVAACDALSDLGVTARQLPVGPHRSPIWPAGVVGSISHNDRMAIAVAQHCGGMADNGLMLGVDVENWIDPAGIAAIEGAISHRSESERLTALSLPHHQRITILFSAKESLFKALYPYVRQYLDFTDSRLMAWDEQAASLTLALTPEVATLAGGPLTFCVHYQCDARSVITLARGRAPRRQTLRVP